MSTLRYANRAKNIKNKPTKNEDPKDAMLRDMQQEMEKLRAMLEGDQATDGVCLPTMSQMAFILQLQSIRRRASFKEIVF